jgi:hypothetical protein
VVEGVLAEHRAEPVPAGGGGLRPDRDLGRALRDHEVVVDGREPHPDRGERPRVPDRPGEGGADLGEVAERLPLGVDGVGGELGLPPLGPLGLGERLRPLGVELVAEREPVGGGEVACGVVAADALERGVLLGRPPARGRAEVADVGEVAVRLLLERAAGRL